MTRGRRSATRPPSNGQSGRIFDKIADRYDRQMGFSERLLFGHSRAWAVSRAHGQVLEIAVGTGLSLPMYPLDTTVLGIDLSERMLDQARRRVDQSGLADR